MPRIDWILVALLVGGLIGGGMAVGYYENTVPVDEPEYRTITKTEYVAPDGYAVFQFTNRRSWEWPTTVEFQTANLTVNEWQTVYNTTVERREPVAVPVNRSKRYRIKATAADGETRVLGSLEIRRDHYEVIIKSCCVDDFS